MLRFLKVLPMAMLLDAGLAGYRSRHWIQGIVRFS